LDLTGKEINSFRSKSGAILNLKYAPDGKSILLASGNNIEVWNIDGSLQRILKGHRYPVLDVKPSPDGQTLASISMDGIVRLWRQNGSFLRELPQEGFSHSITSGISFSPKGKIMATASGNNINLWNYESNTLIRTFKAHTDSVNSVNFSPDGQTVVSASSDRTVRIWDLEGQEIETLTGHTDPVLIAEFSSDGSTLLSAGIDKVIRLWMVGKKGDVTLNGYGDKAPDSVSQSLIDGRESKTINAGGGSVNSISINKENNLIAVASGGIVQIWNRGGKLLNTFQKYGEDTPLIWSIDFSPKNQILALATAEKNIQLWDSDGFKLKVLKGHTAEVKTVKFSPTGSFIASGSVSGEIKIWAYNGVLQKTLVGHEAEITSTSFSPDEQNLASASLDKTIRIWNVKSGIAKVIEHSNSDFEDIQFSPNGQFIAASNQDGVIGIWLKSGKKLRAWKAHSRTTTSISFSPDNQIIASASTDGTVKLWTLNGVLLKTLKVEDSKIWEIKFSSDGKFLASANSNNTVTLWNLNLDNLLVLGCDWIKDYLRSSARLSKEDRTLCDEVSHLSLMDVKPQ
jgi:WD40 repeat protein